MPSVFSTARGCLRARQVLRTWRESSKNSPAHLFPNRDLASSACPRDKLDSNLSLIPGCSLSQDHPLGASMGRSMSTVEHSVQKGLGKEGGGCGALPLL